MTSSSTDRRPAPRPFAYDVEFDETGRIVRDGGSSKLTYTAAELQEAVAKAKAETLAGVKARTAQAIERAADKLASSLLPVLPSLEQESLTLKREAVELGLALSRAVIGKAFDVLAVDVIERGFNDVAESLRHAPRVRVKVAPDLIPALEPVLAAVIARHGLEGRIDLIADPQASPGDWQFAWEAGAVGFDQERALSELQALVRRRLTEPANRAAA